MSFRSPFHLLDILSVSPRVVLMVPVSLKVGFLWLQNLLLHSFPLYLSSFYFLY